MAVLGMSAKPNLLSLALWEYKCKDSHLDTSNTKVCQQIFNLIFIENNTFSLQVDWFTVLF